MSPHPKSIHISTSCTTIEILIKKRPTTVSVSPTGVTTTTKSEESFFFRSGPITTFHLIKRKCSFPFLTKCLSLDSSSRVYKVMNATLWYTPYSIKYMVSGASLRSTDVPRLKRTSLYWHPSLTSVYLDFILTTEITCKKSTLNWRIARVCSETPTVIVPTGKQTPSTTSDRHVEASRTETNGGCRQLVHSLSKTF